MNIKEARDQYYRHSGSASEVNRKLCYAGVAAAWLFALRDGGGNYVLPFELLVSLLLFVSSLALDLMQYVFASSFWGVFHRKKELSGADPGDEFTAPRWINYPAISMFWLKHASSVTAAVFLVKGLICQVEIP